MREIFDLLLSAAEELPPVTTDDAMRLYRTQFIAACGGAVHCVANTTPACTEVSTANHLRAVAAVKEFLVRVVDDATDAATGTVQDVAAAVNTLNGFSAAKRVCAWAARVFKHQRSAAAEDNFVVEKGAPRSESVFDIGEARCKLQAAENEFRNRRGKALAHVFACALSSEDSNVSCDVVKALQTATAASVNDSLTAYRTEIEAPLLQMLLDREKRALAGALTMQSPLSERMQLYERRLGLVVETLHTSSIEAILQVSASIIFPSAADLASAFASFLSADAVASARGRQLLHGLLIPGRESQWLPAGAQRLADLIRQVTSNAADLWIGEAVAMLDLGVDSRLVRDALLLLCPPQPSSLQTTSDAVNSVAPQRSLEQLAARTVDRCVRLGSFSGLKRGFLALFQLLKKHLDVDALLTFAVDLQIRRLTSSTSATSDEDEGEAITVYQKTFGVSRCVQLSQLQLDRRESTAIGTLAEEVFAVGPETQRLPSFSFLCFTEHYAHSLRFSRRRMSFEGMPLPRALQEIASQLDAVYRDRFPRRRMTILHNVSFVTVRCKIGHAFKTIVLLPAHLLVLEQIDGASQTAESLLRAFSRDVAREQVDACLRDLTEAAVLTYNSETEAYTLNNNMANNAKIVVGQHRTTATTTAHQPNGVGRAQVPAMSSAHRRYLIESSIMTELKHLGTTTVDEMYRRCVTRLAGRVQVCAKELKSAISRLCLLEYAVMVDATTLRFLA